MGSQCQCSHQISHAVPCSSPSLLLGTHIYCSSLLSSQGCLSLLHSSCVLRTSFVLWVQPPPPWVQHTCVCEAWTCLHWVQSSVQWVQQSTLPWVQLVPTLQQFCT